MYFEELNFAFHEKSYLWFKVDRFLFPMILCRTLFESNAKKKNIWHLWPSRFQCSQATFFSKFARILDRKILTISLIISLILPEVDFVFLGKSELCFKVDRCLYPMMICWSLLGSSEWEKIYGIYVPLDFNDLKRNVLGKLSRVFDRKILEIGFTIWCISKN